MSRMFLLAIIVIAILIVASGLLIRRLAAPRHAGPVSDHFDGERFHNLDPYRDKTAIEFLRWRFTRKPGRWFSRTFPSQPPPPPRVGEGALRVTFVNHSTVLLQLDGLNILTDPVWSERVSPFSWAGPRRHHSPGVRWDDLPPIDVVLISHNHYDHLDIDTLRRLSSEHHPRIFVGLGNRKFLEKRGIEGVLDIDWGDEARLSDRVRIIAVPLLHWSARTRSDRRNTLWTGFVIEGRGGRVYFAGDTGFGSHFQNARQRFGPFRLALLPIGAYLPRWFMKDNHITPEEALRAHDILAARTSVAIHFGCFPLGDDGQDEPVDELKRLLAARGNALSPMWVLNPGEGRAVP